MRRRHREEADRGVVAELIALFFLTGATLALGIAFAAYVIYRSLAFQP
jgi:hypothetical protein